MCYVLHMRPHSTKLHSLDIRYVFKPHSCIDSASGLSWERCQCTAGDYGGYRLFISCRYQDTKLPRLSFLLCVYGSRARFIQTVSGTRQRDNCVIYDVHHCKVAIFIGGSGVFLFRSRTQLNLAGMDARNCQAWAPTSRPAIALYTRL